MKLDELLEERLKIQSTKRKLTDSYGINHKYLNWRYFFTMDFLDKYNLWGQKKQSEFRFDLAGRAYKDELNRAFSQKMATFNIIDPYLQTR